MELKYRWPKYMQKTIARLGEESMYIKTREKHQDRVILVTSEDELVESMLQLTKEWYDSHWLSREDWYFAGTFDEFFFKEMGVNPVWFEEHVGKVSKHVNRHLEAFAEEGRNLRRSYEYHVEGREDAKFIVDVLTNGLANRAAQLYNLLDNLTYNDSKMFELNTFD